MKRFIFILLFGCLASFVQAQISPAKYKTAEGDGYDASSSESYIWDIFQPKAVCVGEDALFTMQIKGSLLYSYRWYKVGDKKHDFVNGKFSLDKELPIRVG